ncbi:MAG TPA: nitrous oxide reductase accessory protein NosL [Blastocatellia bacterium]|nr:nitrous oxide reductase accessory protein NosL [Blastocatellia bacterium]
MDTVTTTEVDGATGRRGDGAMGRPRAFKFALLTLLLAVSIVTSSCGGGVVVPETAAFGTCPVCRMQVKASDDWAAEIYYKDHTKLMFESPGDMLSFYVSPARYGVDDAHKDRANIQKIIVKDYQSRQPADARQAKFVYKSKVEGPMGPDFLPFSKNDDANAFVAANGGTVLSLDEITSAMIQEVRK